MILSSFSIGRTALFALAATLVASCGTPEPTGTAHVGGSAEQEDQLVHAAWTKNATIYEVNLRQQCVKQAEWG